jgi:DNA repair exonuclease SbcCD ATPase subunit
LINEKFIIVTEKLKDSLENERMRVKKIENDMNDIESSKKMIDDLMQQISVLEKEKLDMVNQYEKYAKLSDEVVNYKKRINEMCEMLENSENLLEKERADRASIEHSQEDLLRKMKDLQKENDELVVRLEGLKSENENLISKNKRLEDRIKIMEDQNKQQLNQVNETLRLPTPIVRDQEAIIASTSKNADILREMVMEHSKEISSPTLSNKSNKSNSSIHLSTSPPNLSVPTINIDAADEMRPASLDKDLKVIPKIVEPTSSSASDALKMREQYASTINSQDVSTIPQDSVNEKNFADIFSQSGKLF